MTVDKKFIEMVEVNLQQQMDAFKKTGNYDAIQKASQYLSIIFMLRQIEQSDAMMAVSSNIDASLQGFDPTKFNFDSLRGLFGGTDDGQEAKS